MPAFDNDTHSNCAQASAIHLTELLQKRYCGVLSLHKAVDGTSLAQASLLNYLQSKLEAFEPSSNSTTQSSAPALSEEERNHPCIAQTVALIDRLEDIESLSETIEVNCKGDVKRISKRQLILEQMQVIASIYPDANWDTNWDANHEKWSTNTIWIVATDGTKRSSTQKITPPAEALNLVAAALLDTDESHNLVEGDDTANTNLARRLESFCLHLQHLRASVRSDSLEKCAAGLQHDLLHLLVGSYLDESGKPYVWETDNSAFLQKSLLKWVRKILSQHNASSEIEGDYDEKAKDDGMGSSLLTNWTT